MGETMGKAMGPLTMAAGAGATAMGMPEVGIPMMMGGMNQTATGGGQGQQGGVGQQMTPGMQQIAQQNPSLAGMNLNGATIAGAMPNAPQFGSTGGGMAPGANGGGMSGMDPLMMGAMSMMQPKPQAPPMQALPPRQAQPSSPAPAPGMGTPSPSPAPPSQGNQMGMNPLRQQALAQLGMG